MCATKLCLFCAVADVIGQKRGRDVSFQLHRWRGCVKVGAAMEKTLFQKIADKEIPAALVYEDELCVAFRDITPVAPVHVLLVPRKPIPSIEAATAEDAALLGHLMLKVGEIARAEGLAEGGFRTVMNTGADAGQTVPHLHIHIIGGRSMQWPPG